MSAAAEFELIEQLHDGRQTRVFRAHRKADGLPVVLKILSEEGMLASAGPQYQREYEITRSLGAIDGVIRVLDLKDVQGSQMIVEEDVGGESLDRILARSRPDPGAALALAIRIAHVLGCVHEHKVIHKDLNPANIVWNPASDQLRLIDFGIASRLGQEHQEFQSPSQLEGTLPYTAPEQTGRVNRVVDARSDLYALGVTLYELFTGVLPFPERVGIELVHAHIAVTPVAPAQVNPEIPAQISRIVMRLLEKMAEDRYQSARGVEHDLKRCEQELGSKGRIDPFGLGEADVPLRFHLPQKLYGRDAEVAQIVAAFDRASRGSAELLLINGAPGVGKSALVHEVHRPLTGRRGNFVSGKFDQYQRDVPFHAWTIAFRELCNLLLLEDEASLARWRARILAAVGGLGRVLTDVVPSIELIIGEQEPVSPLAGEQALNRLRYVFGNFINAVGVAEHPLVIFIDDWQWADAGSLSLLKSVMGGGENEHLLVIGAYRDSEVEESHPFARTMEELNRSGTRIATLKLQSLKHEDVHNLVCDALPGAEALEDLSRLAFGKTQGNAFFLVQLLNDLYERSAIRFDRQAGHWSWNRAAIEAAKVADNVVELMAGRISGLPEGARKAVVHGSCIGDRFLLGTLAHMLERRPHLVAGDLEAALQEGILIPVGNGYRLATQESNTTPVPYQFVHDRVRQAAYGMLGEGMRERLHRDVARYWMEVYSHEEQDRNIFEIANQYNAGRAVLGGADERAELMRVNLRAGKRAKLAADYASAFNYFANAIELLGTDRCWTEEREQTSELFLLACEVAFLSKDYRLMESWLGEYLAHVHDPLDRVAGLRIRIQAYVAQNRLSEAVEVSLSALRLLGLALPSTPGKGHVLVGLLQTRFAVRRKPIPELRRLPEMTDPVRLAIMDLLGLMLPPAYWTSPNLLALTVFQMVRETLAHGYSPNAGYGLSWWGITESALLGNIPAGAQFGEFAIEIARKHALKLQQPLFFAGWIIHKFTHPLRETMPLLEQAYAVSLEKGDFEYASYARNNYVQMLLHSGHHLTETLAEMERAHRDLLRFQVGSSLYWHDIWWQTALNLVSGPAEPDVLSGPAYDETVSLEQHRSVNDHSTLFLLHTAKTMLALIFGRTEAALAHAHAARLSNEAGTGMHSHVLFHYFESLVLIAAADKGLADVAEVRRVLAANQKRLAHWAQHAPMNYLHLWCLVEAERLRSSGKGEEAMHQYERAMELARENGFVQDEALASELAARFQFRQRRDGLATFYLRQALQLYERWGCSGKVTQLRGEFPMQLLTVSGGSALARTTRTFVSSRRSSSQGADAFDAEAIVKASQAISGEIVIESLVKSLLKIVIEHSGAQKAILLLQHEGELSIEATAVAGDEIAVTIAPVPFSRSGDLPLPRSVIQYVSRTLKAVVIDDARLEHPFERDPYVVERRPLSLLCEPILRQGVLAGMLYLENDLMAGVFTKGRLELLRVLSAQAAISIQNALLYGQLENKVSERTRKLQDSLATQERLNVELQASGMKLETALEQLREASRLLEERANTDGLTGLANRRYFGERLEYELGRCERERQPLSLILCDLDNFKLYNDLYGHVAGDECLRQAAKAIRGVFGRTIDLVARYGGEEFVVLLPATDGAEAARIGEKMRLAIAALAIPHGANAQYGIVTLSVGCHTVVPTPVTAVESVIAAADRALYKAKDRGRNCLVSEG